MQPDDKKERLDVLVSRGWGFSREYAKQVIESGNVFVTGALKTKPGEKIDSSSQITVTAEKMKYISRGGFKLEKALDVFGINLADKTCLDVGASTGGFTDCMLKNGAKKVFAVDTGVGQMSDQLLNTGKVILMEKTNIKDVMPNDINDFIAFVSVDVSFISLEKIMPAISRLIIPAGEVVCLIKPQFEAGKAFVGKNGIVKDIKIHKRVIYSIYMSMIENELNPLSFTFSPIKGMDGNIEYLIYAKKEPVCSNIDFKQLIDNVTGKAFADLRK